ncbi:ornithine cyclodeaminase family protein [Peribacillus sp. SI8-4]|uniref:ornithine cyclodeaminase family protein n=1 Tax=Peribacillus sp. SI8-4 TaxID=3048009 RepID=UPI0025558737|nr:ornithine cyclodeaminase family protein [Peribacillus sp. SI8-4]
MSYQVLTDTDVLRLTRMKPIIEAIERVFLEQANATLVSPPRFQLKTENGSLVFTAGAATTENVIGFRVYDTYSNEHLGHEQLVSVFDSMTGVFKGVVIGNLLGAIRTGAIGGAAIQAMSRPDAKQLAIIGTGMQARTQLEAAIAVRDIEQVLVYSRHDENRIKFTEEMSEKFDLDVIPADSAKKCVEKADIIICATNSRSPVIDADWIKPGVHINTVGPKSMNGHELPMEAARKSSVLSTDSLEQLSAYSTPHFLANTPYAQDIVQLSDIIAGNKPGRTSMNDVTVFCSVGLSGTEVVVAHEIMKMAQNKTYEGMGCTN